jgi:hypothetical protein
VQAYVLLGNAEGAAEAQQIQAETNPSVGTIGTLAQFRYLALDLKGGDEAVAELEELSAGNVESTLKQLETLREQVVKEKKRIAKLPESEQGAEEGLQSPFGGLDQGGSVPPTSP